MLSRSEGTGSMLHVVVGVSHLLILDYPSFPNFKALLRKSERHYACGPRAPQLKFPDGNQL